MKSNICGKCGKDKSKCKCPTGTLKDVMIRTKLNHPKVKNLEKPINSTQWRRMLMNATGGNPHAR